MGYTLKELGTLVEDLILLRDTHEFSIEERDLLATACNVIYNNREWLTLKQE